VQAAIARSGVEMACRDRRKWGILLRHSAMTERAMARSNLLICDAVRFRALLSGGWLLHFNKLTDVNGAGATGLCHDRTSRPASSTVTFGRSGR
jgi:hypothetical protein